MILGAVLAGGRSSRFGSDKALAEIGGKPLLAHVADALAAQADALVVVGRDWPALDSIADRPAPAQGPLGGLCAALHHARGRGFDAVLTAGCDVLPVPPHLIAILCRSSESWSPYGASDEDGGRMDPSFRWGDSKGIVVKNQPLFGLWPAALADTLDAHLAATDDRSMRGWIAASGARTVPCNTAFHNLNTRADFALYCASEGMAA